MRECRTLRPDYQTGRSSCQAAFLIKSSAGGRHARVETAAATAMIPTDMLRRPLILMLCLSTGCSTVPKAGVERRMNGMVYVLPGIEGKSRFNISVAKGLADGGVEAAIEIFDWTTWTGPFGWFVHLTDERRNRINAIKLARTVIRYRKQHPYRPVYLVAHSGGAGIALMAAELLPEHMRLEGIILLAAAVDPDRNLIYALSRTRRGIWNFYSKHDIGFLVLGTSLFGTIDRKFGASAGAVGFNVPEDLPREFAELYKKKLHQIEYDPVMAHDGNPGSHSGWTKPRFVSTWLAPIIRGTNTLITGGDRAETDTHEE